MSDGETVSLRYWRIDTAWLGETSEHVILAAPNEDEAYELARQALIADAEAGLAARPSYHGHHDHEQRRLDSYRAPRGHGSSIGTPEEITLPYLASE